MGLQIGLISNPLSGGNRKGLQPIEKMLAGDRRILHRQAVEPRQVAAAIQDFARHGVNLVGINGGDGTISAALTALFTTEWPDRLPLLVLLRAGTTSMLARDVGLPGSRLQGLSRLLDWARSGSGAASLVKRPILRLEWERGGDPLYGMFFGTGGIYEGIKFCHARVYKKRIGGELAAGLTLARFLLAALRGDRRTIPPAVLGVGLEGREKQDLDVLLLLVTSLERLFLGIRPFWGSEEGPLRFTAIRSYATYPLLAAPSLIRGRKSRWTSPQDGYLSHKLRNLRLALSSGFTLDGQLYESDPRRGDLLLSSGGEVEFLKL
ncbi:MAG: putative lipid kinase [Syntrophus sp. PtaU1.Bin208]|nr:MAG: putative lipid kinase [Syntrophus sp. PtaU1.Bin208]